MTSEGLAARLTACAASWCLDVEWISLPASRWEMWSADPRAKAATIRHFPPGHEGRALLYVVEPLPGGLSLVKYARGLTPGQRVYRGTVEEAMLYLTETLGMRAHQAVERALVRTG